MTTTTTKVRRLVDATVEADLSAGLWYGERHDPELKARALERLVADFQEHVRDHRSLDFIRLHVQRVIEDQCSACHSPWEPVNGRCAHCDALIT